MKKKKVKINNKKFLSRVAVILGIVILVIQIFRVTTKVEKLPGLKPAPQLIVDTVNVTSSLSHDIYIDKDGLLYMAMEDIKNIFDKNLYYEEETKKAITTSGTKTAAIDIINNTMEINSASLLLNTSVLELDGIIYLPVSEMKKVYNIDIVTSDYSAVVLSLYKALTTVSTKKNLEIKEDTGLFANKIQKVEKGQELIFIENAEKTGWYKVLTYEGSTGFVRSKDVNDKKQIRTNMDDDDFTVKEADMDNAIELTRKSIKDDNIKDFSSRKKLIDDTLESIIDKEKYTVKLNLNKVELNSERLERLIIEFVPRLKEIGGTIVITNNDNVLSERFIKEMNLYEVENEG